ncbi:MAG TPA: GNAT family N-acetyltransferase [Candidatus Limnocylindria bacterium]
MEIDVRPFAGEPRAFFDAGELAFAEKVHDDDLAHWTASFEADRAITALDGDRIVGTAGIFSFELTVPGASVPAAGVTIVGVHPTHRRRGILRRMMRLQLDAIHERGEPIAILWASEGNIYQRFGYGLASLHAGIKLARDRSAFRLPLETHGSVRFVEPDEGMSLFPPIFDAVLPDRPGFFARSATYWEHEFFPDPKHWRRGAGPAFHVVHETDGTADAYARYRIREKWENSGPESSLNVVEVMGTNPAAELGIWQFLLGVDLIGQIEAWNLANDDPLLLNIAEPRRLRMEVGDGLWLRVVDVAAALAGRRYRGDGSLVIELTDAFCEWNAGRWALSVSDGSPTCQPSTEAADIACDVTDLGAAYLGAFSFAQLAAAGRVRELAAGGVVRADRLFRTDRAPWCPRVF